MPSINYLILFLFSLLIISCSEVPPKKITTTDWNKATHQVVKQYSSSVDHSLQPTFKKAKVDYPPQDVALLAFKDERKMELWAKDRYCKDWKHIKDYNLTATSGKLGPKLKYHDDQIPEGIYHLVMLNPFSALQLSMRINYPNEFDQIHGAIDGRKDLGGDIFIHGHNLSVGCIAIGDAAINELFVLAARTGTQNVKVIIAPNDLRINDPVTDLSGLPEWVPDLYEQIDEELEDFTD